MTNEPLPRLVLTTGEPAGIGPDIALSMAAKMVPASLTYIADPGLMRERAKALNLDVKIDIVRREEFDIPHQPGCLRVLAVDTRAQVIPGKLNAENSAYVLDMLELATTHLLKHQFDALVTAPVHKEIINQSGTRFTGHTEYLAELTGGRPVMMLIADSLRVALVTTHIPLDQVSSSLSSTDIVRSGTTLADSLSRLFAIKRPRITVCGLNPHAGEGGYLGREEQEVIRPAINTLKELGVDIYGPIPGDTAFTPASRANSDAILAMYHDQGLAPLKALAFGHAVNVTLGLPIIRTSVDHGTALELAATGQANDGSLLAATNLAITLFKNQQKDWPQP